MPRACCWSMSVIRVSGYFPAILFSNWSRYCGCITMPISRIPARIMQASEKENNGRSCTSTSALGQFSVRGMSLFPWPAATITQQAFSFIKNTSLWGTFYYREKIWFPNFYTGSASATFERPIISNIYCVFGCTFLKLIVFPFRCVRAINSVR